MAANAQSPRGREAAVAPARALQYPPPPECENTSTAIEAVRRMFVDNVQYHHIMGTTPGATPGSYQDPSAQTPARRAAFIKQHGGAYAVFQVADNLPDGYAAGIFQPGARYTAWVRFSSDIADYKPDLYSTVGVGIKLFGIPGAKVLKEDENCTNVDLVLQNTPSFFASDAMEMCAFKHAALEGYLAGWRAEHPVTDKILSQMSSRIVDSLLTETLWSCIPYQFGANAYCKYKLENTRGIPNPVAAVQPEPAPDPNYLTLDLRAQLKKGPVALDFLVQLRNDPETQSLTDATDAWDERAAVPVKVATLLIPQQDITARGQADYSEVLSYSIWRTLQTMAPVGSIAEVRKVVYQSSARMRRNVNGQPIGEPALPRPPGPPSPPFAPDASWPPAAQGAGPGGQGGPPTPGALFIAGQRSTSFAYEPTGAITERARVQMLTGYLRQPGSQATPIVPQLLTWQYAGGLAPFTGRYFPDTRPELALTVSSAVPSIAPVVLAPCRVMLTPGTAGVLLDDGTAMLWVPQSGPQQSPVPVPGGVALAGSTHVAAVIMKDGTLMARGDDAALAGALGALEHVAGMSASASGFVTLSASGAVSQQGPVMGSAPPASMGTCLFVTTTLQAYCAVGSDGGITAWGAQQSGGDGAPANPAGATCIAVIPTLGAFAALASDGAVLAWGDPNYGGGSPAGVDNVSCLAATAYAYAALKTDGTVVAWGIPQTGGTAPAGLANVVQLAAASNAFAALNADGTVAAWGADELVDSLPAQLSGVVAIYAARHAFAALMAEGTVTIWGRAAASGSSDPATWKNIVAIQSAGELILAVDDGGGVHAWSSDAAYLPPALVLEGMQNTFSLLQEQQPS